MAADIENHTNPYLSQYQAKDSEILEWMYDQAQELYFSDSKSGSSQGRTMTPGEGREYVCWQVVQEVRGDPKHRNLSTDTGRITAQSDAPCTSGGGSRRGSLTMSDLRLFLDKLQAATKKIFRNPEKYRQVERSNLRGRDSISSRGSSRYLDDL